MPKYHKQPKGSDAHQHVAGDDWTQAEPWVQELIAAGRLVPGPPATLTTPGAVPIPILPTDWLVLELDGVLLLMPDALFQATL